jgi:hypothetical protein
MPEPAIHYQLVDTRDGEPVEIADYIGAAVQLSEALGAPVEEVTVTSVGVAYDGRNVVVTAEIRCPVVVPVPALAADTAREDQP